MNRRLVPIADWIRSYQREWLRRDLIAGVIVTALIVPKNLGYAGIAGIPLQNGLYAAAAGAVLYAIFGTCRQISMGPSSGLAAVAAAAVLAAGISGEQDVATFVAGITLVSGLLFVLLAVFRMGWIAQFLSRAVVTGFLFGAAIDVVIGELPKLTGTDVSGDNSFQELRSWFGSLAETSGSTLVVGAVALIVVFGLRRVAPRVPGALVLVVGGLLASWMLDLEGRGVAVVGTVPRGLPAFDVPDLGLMWDHVVVVVLAGVAVTLIGFSQTAGDARAFAAKHHYQVDINQESVAQAMANTGAGLLQGMPVSTSLSASSLNDRSGARTGLASLTSGVMVLLTLLVPRAALLGPAEARAGRPDHRGGRDGHDGPARDAPTLAGAEVRLLGRDRRPRQHAGLRRAGGRRDRHRPVAAVAGPGSHQPGDRRSRTAARNPGLPRAGRAPGDEQIPGVVIIRLDGGLFFATSDTLEDRLRQVIHTTPDLTGIVLDCEGINFVDSQGAAKLMEMVELAEESGITLRLARLKTSVRPTLKRDGVFARFGPDRIHGNVFRAVQAQLAADSREDLPD